ncbi:fungal-specific transcription factor domain-containing protein [Aspergillus germanicus]
MSWRVADGLLFQDRVLSLLHHGRASGINTADCKPFTSSISDELWHGIVPRYSVASQELATPQSRQPSYFQLFHPFIKVLDCVIENPVKHTESWRMAIEKAENVYFDFPPDLLLLDAIEFAYQAETMIWLHGAFIVLYGHLDILSLLFEPQFLHKEQFAKILDHSFLLSEVLPHLLRLNPPLTFLSPATVLFILLSSAVQSLALRQYFPFQSHSSHDGLTVPQRLFESSRLHLRALSTLSTQAGRWQHELIAEVHRLLSYCTSRVLHQADSQEPPFSAVNLMRYRWCGSGSGVLPLSPAAARQEWHFSSLPESELWSGPTGDEEALRNVVAELCNPSARMCRSGYLDLSHFYAHDTSLHRDGSLLSRLTLNGQDNQAIRFLVNRFQRSFVAIGESGCPLLDEILPLAGSYPSILSALLALAARLRAPHTGAERFGPGGAATADYLTPSDTGSPASNALSWHQATISGIRSKLLRIQTEHTEEGDLKEILAASLLLTIFGFPQQINNWSMHVQGMIALIESTDPAMVESLPIARLVRAFAAHNDIYAFSLGRPEESHRAWLNWDIWPRESSGARTTNLTLFEITIGYPESMITLIAIMSGAFDDTAKYGRLSTSLHARLKHTFDSALATTRLPLLRDLHSLAAPACGGLSWPTMMEVILESWTPPPIPQHISFKLSVAILIAWECIRKAALIYLWRGGFDANATTPLDPIRGPTAQSYLRQLLHNINGLLSLAETNRITIANAMLWTLVVVGNECCRETGLRAELLRVLTRAHEYFSITHFGHGIRLLEELWARVDDALVDREDGQGQGQGWLQRPLHLQALAKELDLCVPLF